MFVPHVLTRYLAPHKPAKDENIKSITEQLKAPWAALGDYNNTKHELEDAGWEENLRAKLIIPTNAPYTCRSGQGANRLIDYAIVSYNMLPLLKALEAHWAVPWGPHCGLTLHLTAKPAVLKVWAIRMPLRIQPPTVQMEVQKSATRLQNERKRLRKKTTQEETHYTKEVAYKATQETWEQNWLATEVETNLLESGS